MSRTSVNNNVLVSVITPCYNSQQFIGESINSVLTQTFANWEMIIVDDCSTDDSRDVVQQYCDNDDRIKLICLDENRGACRARNEGIRAARGRYIAFLDSDDIWLPHKLDYQVHYLRENDVPLIGSGYDVINEEGKYLYSVDPSYNVSFSMMLFNNYLGCLTVMYDSYCLGKRYFPVLEKQEDWALWLDILKSVKYARLSSRIIAVYRKRKVSMTSDKLGLIKYNWRVYKNYLGYSMLYSLTLFSVFLCYYSCKASLHYLKYLRTRFV